MLWVVVTFVFLGKLASKQALANHGGWLLSRPCLDSLHAELVNSLRKLIRDIMTAWCVAVAAANLGGIRPGDKVSYMLQFCASIDDGGHHPHTTAMGPHSRLLSIQQSANILYDRLVLFKLEKLSLLMFISSLRHNRWTNHHPWCLLVVMVVLPMQSISGNNEGTHTLYMAPLSASMLGLPCRLCSGPRQLKFVDY